MEVKRRAARSLVQRLTSDSDRIRSDATCELRLLSKHDPDSRLFIAEAGAVPLLVQTLYSVDADAQENAVATLFNISISHREPLMSTPVLVDALGHVLRHPKSPSAAQTAAATLHSLLVVDAYRPIIGSKPHLLTPLIHLIQNPNSPTRSIKDGLKALFGVSLYPLNRPRLVELGIVPPLFNLVLKDSRLGIVEDSTAVIAQVAGCFESVEVFRQVAGVKVLVDLLDASTGSTLRVKENAVSALLNLVRCGGDAIGEDFREMGFAWDGILEVAETGSAKLKARATDLLNLIGEAEKRLGKVPLWLYGCELSSPL
ncbi:hypothetical protein H6P81_002632 [Aristolochia fimbriata]|uniref:U-box domain-containing protein n=1 Tax=Aristolochia fimbriata TaxID=158543 RepID=A0AAV7FC31_ARIFI|nr:hypothetical protein H6P81_002632 [Aristolochia fimbriata]